MRKGAKYKQYIYLMPSTNSFRKNFHQWKVFELERQTFDLSTHSVNVIKYISKRGIGMSNYMRCMHECQLCCLDIFPYFFRFCCAWDGDQQQRRQWLSYKNSKLAGYTVDLVWFIAASIGEKHNQKMMSRTFEWQNVHAVPGTQQALVRFCN